MLKNLKECLRLRGPIGFLIFGVYRFGNYVYYDIQLPLLKPFLYFIYQVLEIFVIRIIGKAQIPAKAKIGKFVGLSHDGNGVIIHPMSVIGDHVIIFHQVTIGYNNGGAPLIRDRVTIGAGAKILGPIEIGEGAVIGANAVVVKDIPPHSIAVGVPARIIKK